MMCLPRPVTKMNCSMPAALRFFDGVLDDRLVDDRQHLLGHCFRCGKKTRAHAGDGEDGFSNRSDRFGSAHSENLNIP